MVYALRDSSQRGFRQASVCECGDHGFVGLTRGAVAFFSPGRIHDVAPYRWNLIIGKRSKGYGRAQVGGRQELLHRHIAKPGRHQCVDHRDGDTLNNKDENLRVCLHAENTRNKRTVFGRVGFKGVIQDPQGHGFLAIASLSGRRIRSGPFATAEEAARAYDRAAVELHGEFAATNAALGLLSEVAA